jgi:DNA-binding SARP family transcriptional activator
LPRLTLSFLGCFHVCLDDRPVTCFKSNKVRALLAYLAVEADRPHRREALAGLLWPDRTDRDALSNLRYALASLRRTIGDHAATPPFLLITPQTIQFNPASDYWLDVAELGRQIADGAEPVSAQFLYRGSFLPGFSIGGAAPFEEWALLRREQISVQVMSLLGSLAAYHEARGDYQAAQSCARQQVALEPWSEEAHRTLMRVLALDGQRSAALHQYHTCRDLLRDELGVEPTEETVALYEAVRAGLLVHKETRKQGNKTTPIPLSTHLPVSLSPPFVAREVQLARLDASLQQALAGAGGVAFVTGEAGSGKTALLGEFARQAMEAHADLVVATGYCNVVAGLGTTACIGDSYLPFREILQLLSGDIEAKRASAALTPEHTRRLWAILPDTITALMEAGPDLLDTFVPRASLVLRAEAFAGQAVRGAWKDQLSRLQQPPGGESRNRQFALQQADLFGQVTRVLQLLARGHPLLLILDDLQWADAGSVSLLFHLGRRLAGSRILVVAAYRPDAIAPDSADARHPLESVVNELQRVSGDRPIDLDHCKGRQFVEALLDAEPNRLSAGFRAQLVRHTDGHPLFTVELLRGLREGGDLVRDADGCWEEGPALHWEKLPARVEAVIAERIGRLPDRCRALLAAASVEGEEFTAEISARVLGVDESSIRQCLDGDLGDRHRLVAAVSLRRLGARKLSRYRFRHHLFQRYLYDHLDVVQRVNLHEAVGSALEALCGEAPDDLDALAPRLAWHFEMAGLLDRAATYCLQAGRRAARLAAHEDAISHLTRGLALLEWAPDSPDVARLKLELLLAIASPLVLARGFWSPERLRVLEQVYELARHPALADSPERAAALAVVANFALSSAEPARTLQLSEQLLGLAERVGDPQQLLIAHFLLGSARWLRGDLDPARRDLDEALALKGHYPHLTSDLPFGFDIGITSLARQACVLWLLGHPDQASRSLQEAVNAAQARGHPITLALTRGMAGMILAVIGRDAAAARLQVDALRQLSAAGLFFEPWADSLAGRSSAEENKTEESLQQMRQGLAAFQMVGTPLGRAAQLVLLAQGYARTGKVEAAMAALDEALTWMGQTGVCMIEAETHRLRGELLLAGWSPGMGVSESAVGATAAACFRRAIIVARQQQARWWELRATISLYRLLEERNGPQDTSRTEARQMLAEVYGWFTEGFDMPDLQEARALLAEDR